MKKLLSAASLALAVLVTVVPGVDVANPEPITAPQELLDFCPQSMSESVVVSSWFLSWLVNDCRGSSGKCGDNTALSSELLPNIGAVFWELWADNFPESHLIYPVAFGDWVYDRLFIFTPITNRMSIAIIFGVLRWIVLTNWTRMLTSVI